LIGRFLPGDAESPLPVEGPEIETDPLPNSG
jgi:hypothetical protein